MRNLSILTAAAIAVGCLGGCNKPAPSDTLLGRHGRYVGLGIYSPGESWTRVADAQPPKQDTPAARHIDDQAIIVVADSDTGEIRACGDMTGYCVGMNPWSHPLSAAQQAPINLTRHVQPPPAAEPVP